jgi:hypothetical protein
MSVWTNTKKQKRQAHLRAASLVESSEQIKIEATVLAELRKDLYSISEAVVAKDESDRSAARFDAIAAYENARSLLKHSPFPITESSIQETMRRLESAIGSYLTTRRLN